MSDEQAKQILAELREIKSMLSPTLQPANDMLTISEAAKYLRISVSSFYRNCRAKITPAYTTGPVRYRKQDLDTFKATGRTGVQWATKRRKSA